MSTLLEPQIIEDEEGIPHEAEAPPQLVGLMAEFTTVDEVMTAAKRVRSAGFLRWDVHTPFPIHGIDAAMGIRPTILPWLVLGAGLFGLFGGLGLEWYCNAFDYKFLISGKPLWSIPANIPICFETTVLCASLTAVFGMLGLNRLPQLYNPLFKSDRFRRVTNDRFFVVLDASDTKFNETDATRMFEELGAASVERIED